MAFWVLLLLSLWEGGVVGVGEESGGQGGVLKNGASKKTWVYPQHPWLLYLWVMWVFPSRPQWWLLPRWSLGCKHCHSQEARRHKNLQGCSLFPWPSLSTIQIDIFGAAKKSAKNSAGPRGYVRCGCGIWGPSELASLSKKLICEWWGAAALRSVLSCTPAKLLAWLTEREEREWRKCGAERKRSALPSNVEGAK